MIDMTERRPHAPGWQQALAAAQSATRCGATTRAGTPCKGPAVRDRPRCRMHGCAPGSGGPHGPRNGRFQHGNRTEEARAARGAVRALLHRIRTTPETK